MILINPQARKMGIFTKYSPMSIPGGIGYLAAYLLEQDEPVSIHDDEIELLDESTLEGLVANQPKPYIFGFSCVTAGIARAMDLARFVKAKFPDSKVIMGGIHPSVMPEEPLFNSPTDVVVVGQGEVALWELIQAYRGGTSIEKINSIAYKADDQIIRTPRNKLISLSDLPDFPFHLFEDHQDRYDFGWVMSSLGCPYDCIFCSQRAITGLEVCYNSNERVVRQIKMQVERYHVKSINFVDDNLVINKKRMIDFCDRIVKAGLHEKVFFEGQTRGDAINEDVLIAMKRANFRTVFFGIETASARLMKLIQKGETLEQIKEGVRLAKKHGFLVSATFILGFPTETDEERRAAYRMACDLDLDFARFNNAAPYPGTKFYEMAQKEGTFNPGKRWEHMNAVLSLVDHPFKPSPLCYVPVNISESELRRDVLRFNLFFSLRPSRLKFYLKGVGGKGTFILPKGWYFRPKELYLFFRFCFRVFLSLIRVII